ncbi:uncharacterized protein F4807DRAFT_30108 [Annulohypoxylon truncatum]|uniref:uncharacterized protein n=1 Tax=Annulohypoxylon truncatum TaxID=327061 RepID=UPI002008E9C2|nr:uncharacterized protein F4807DRAFT_30108 [Annulohypoxylon truncatum]KAI1211259.1 hypothetical protein F4807DRAFT_30108 [Annulohypoxylon truncatum]
MASIQDLLSPTVDQGSKETGAKGQDTFSGIEDVQETTHFVVEFILDVVCPYCYIGFKNLTAAIATYTATHPEATFEVVCSPYLLDPLATRSAYDKSTYLNSPKHSPEHWRELGRQAGIDFTWEGRTGSTRDAHKLLRYALEPTPTTARSTAFASRNRNVGQNQSSPPPPAPAPGSGAGPNGIHSSSSSSEPLRRGPALQLRMLSALLHAHHETSADISSPSFLTSLFSSSSSPNFPNFPLPNHANHANLDLTPSTVHALLEDPSWDRAIEALSADARERPGLSVRAVPTFVVNDRYVIGGAQSVGFLLDVFARIGAGRGFRDGVGVGDAETGIGEGEGGGTAGEGGVRARERFYEEGGGRGGSSVV